MGKTTTLAFISDLHAGSTLAPCPQPIELDNGGMYEPSKVQRYLNAKLDQFWGEVENARRDRLGVVLNGDLVDGQVKQSAEVISPHPHVEFAVIKDILAPLSRLRPNFIYVTRGTEAHTGKAGHKDEAVAHYLAKEQKLTVERCPDTGRYSHQLAAFRVAGHLIWASHHGKTGSVGWSNVINNRALHIWLECTKRGHPAPELVVQAHNHKFDDSGWKHPTRVVQQPAWQLKTAHAHKVAAMELSDLGGVLVQARSHQRLEVEPVVYPPDPSTVKDH